MNEIEIRRHPAGGWTLAWPVGGTAREYRGWWPTAALAAAGLSFFRSAVGGVSFTHQHSIQSGSSGGATNEQQGPSAALRNSFGEEVPAA